MALACGVSTSVTSDLNSSISRSPISPPFSFASAFCSDPRWSMAAAAMTPRLSDTAFIPVSLPAVNFTSILLRTKRSFYYRKDKVLYRRRRHSGLYEAVDVEHAFSLLNLNAARFRRRMLWREQRATVLVRNDRDRKRSQPLGLCRNLILVHADQRTQDGKRYDLVDRRQVLERLRRDL